MLSTSTTASSAAPAATSSASLITINHIWLSLEGTDMRGGIDSLLSRVVQSFAGGAVQHSAYIFSNKAANRLKVLIYDGQGIWLCTRRLQSGRFVWPRDQSGHISISGEQLRWLVAGAPWQQLNNPQTITRV
ncbi:MAG: IS66 family insertion sequence element accessory protein TnpB [Brachymonas sp.]|nr:IS66 family insertion sequence element accessory protein TnpB [Brachymonas sp.]NJS37444.1 IS66 family insertion sequence element accessory protein TnpB [Brachymonas sp.]